MSGLIMTDEIATADAEADTNSVDNTNISVADLANRRLGQMQAQAEPQEEEVEEASEEVEEEAAEEVIEETEEETQEETEETTEEQSEDVLSQLDLDDMSEDDLRELADKLGSRAVARFGELTAKRKASRRASR
jgi:wyosine [tRNA(Phe)-imidazoG37] synthetase (radical SAM superfamily)